MNMPLVLLNRRRRGGSFSPYTLFSGTAIGTWFDPSDLATMYQDAAGTTAVTTPGQPVGLRLDKSKGLALGAELVDAFTLGTGWSYSGGVLTSTGTATLQAADETTVAVAGRSYLVTFRVAASSGLIQVRVGNTFLATLNLSGTYTYRVAASGPASVLSITSTTPAFVGSIDNISVRELPGNHATQSVLASRPTYGIEPAGGRRNLLVQTEAWNVAPWGPILGAVVTADAGAAPNGTTTADRTTFPNQYATQFQPLVTVAGVSYTFSFYAKHETGNTSLHIFHDASASGNTTPIVVTSTWQRFSVTVLGNATSGTVSFGIQDRNTSGFGSTLVWGAQLELGSTATNYQRVTTAFDVTEAGVQTCHYVQYDGTDDGMITNSIDFTATDKMSVFAGVRKTSDATFAAFLELSDLATKAGAFGVSAPQTGAGANYSFGSAGSTAVLSRATSPGSFAAPISNVLTGLGDISGDLSTLRLNGTQVAQATTDQGTGNYGNYPLYLGRRGGTTLPFNGRDYGIVVVGKATTATEITSTENWLAAKTGFYAPVITGVPTIGVS